MEKLILLTVAVLLTCNVLAQTSKGTVALTGSLGYTQSERNSKKVDNTSSYTESQGYTLSPVLGVFLRDNLEVGVNAYRQRETYKSSSPIGDGQHIWESEEYNKGIRVYAKQYKYLAAKLAVHGTLSAGLSNMEYKTSSVSTFGPNLQSYQSDRKFNSVNVWLSPGVTFFASEKIGLNASLGALTYRRSNDKTERVHINQIYPPHNPAQDEFSLKTNALRLDFSSMNLNFGISYFLGK